MADTILLTGGTGGIGRAITVRLVASGYAVLIGDLAVERGAGSPGSPGTADVDVAPGTVMVRELDVRATESVDAAVAAAARMGRLRGIVNCAGILRGTPAASMDDARIEQLWQVNVAGMARVCRAATPHLTDGAAIVNISSIVGSIGRFAGTAIYASSKAGMEGFTRVLACELAPRGVRVNAIAPGFIRVGMSPDWEGMSGGEDALARQVPLGRLGETAEVAEAVEFLLSARSSYITGTVLFVDGGVAAW